MADDLIRCWLLRGKELTTSDVASLRDELLSKPVKDLRKVASSLSMWLTGSAQKYDIVERLTGMAQIRRSDL